MKLYVQKILYAARLSFIRDPADRLQIVLAITILAGFLVVLFGVHILGLNMAQSFTVAAFLTLFIYSFVGKLLERMKQTLSSQRRFVSNVAHELNSSMSIMQLDPEAALHATDTSYRRGLSKRKSKELIDALKTDLSGLRNMANIIQNLATMTSYEYRPGQMARAQVELSSLLERLCGEVSKQFADKKNIHISVDMDKTSPVYMLGNEAALRQMIVNLLSNAVKYSPVGGRVIASLSATPHEIVLSVEDNGIGMSEDDMHEMFSPFYRSSDNQARKEGGSGLGLAIVNEVAKEHQAKVYVTSVLRKGTGISVHFPAIS